MLYYENAGPMFTKALVTGIGAFAENWDGLGQPCVCSKLLVVNAECP